MDIKVSLVLQFDASCKRNVNKSTYFKEKKMKKMLLLSLIALTLIGCAASPDNENAATVGGNYAPARKPASVQAAQMIAPATH